MQNSVFDLTFKELTTAAANSPTYFCLVIYRLAAAHIIISSYNT